MLVQREEPVKTPSHFPAMTTLSCILATILAILIGTLLWLSETPADRARRWHRSGVSQRVISERLGVTRYRVRIWLTA
jgi:hypothetical protein